jgi:hypothetical protein
MVMLIQWVVFIVIERGVAPHLVEGGRRLSLSPLNAAGAAK